MLVETWLGGYSLVVKWGVTEDDLLAFNGTGRIEPVCELPAELRERLPRGHADQRNPTLTLGGDLKFPLRRDRDPANLEVVQRLDEIRECATFCPSGHEPILQRKGRQSIHE